MNADESLTLSFDSDVVASCPQGRYTVTLFSDAVYNSLDFSSQQCVDVFKTSLELTKTFRLARLWM